MYVQKVSIKNIRAIKDAELDFGESPKGWHILIGDNGSGKTTILRAIAASILRGEQIYPYWTHWLSKGETTAEIVTTIEKSEDDEHNSTEGKDIFDRTIDYKDGTWNRPLDKTQGYGRGWFSMSFGSKRTFDAESKDRGSFFAIAHLSLLESNYVFSKIISWLKDQYYESLEEAKDESKDEKNQPIFSSHNKKSKFFDHLKELLNSGLLPNGVQLVGLKKDGGDSYPLFKNAEGQDLYFSELSEGYQSVLIIAIEIIRQARPFFESYEPIFKYIKEGKAIIPISGVILIDEPDVHLHPTWQAEIGQWFTKYFPNIQFIVSTHSPLICRAAGENGKIWKVVGGKVVPIEGVERDRLVFGDLDDAIETEQFGNVEMNEQNLVKKKRLRYLSDKELLGLANEEEKAELKHLQEIFNSYA